MCCPYLNTLVSGSPIIQNGKLVGATFAAQTHNERSEVGSPTL